LTQFMRIMSNFSWQDVNGNLYQVPIVYGDMNRMAANIMKKNSENTIPSAPFIACYIKDLAFDRSRMQDPTFVSTVQIAETATDANGNVSINQQGANYSVDRIMPSPHLATFCADIWTTNTDQKLQIWEQIAVLFNPSLELQTTTNYIDWTSLSVLTLDNQVWSNRTIPQGVNADIDILTMTFKTPIWITAPAKVKQLGIVTNIINSVAALAQGDININFADPNAVQDFTNPDVTVKVTPGNFDIVVLNNNATLIRPNNQGSAIDTTAPQNIVSWHKLLDLYPGQYTAGLSQLRLLKPDGNEIVAYMTLNPLNETQMNLNFDVDTIPANTILGNGQGTVDAIINPQTYNPLGVAANTVYLILDDINPGYGTPGFVGVAAWKNADGSDFHAVANDIIQWDGANWSIVFDSTTVTTITYITNLYTGIQYEWDGTQWSKSFEGVYANGDWRLVL